jgi:DNA-binding response OmpR family regulator
MSAGGRGRSLRILVVDDDPAMVGAVTALVGLEGHRVITAYDGLTAVGRYREEAPDIVLLDLAMPGPDGFGVIARMRGLGDAPIIVVSGESGEAAKVRALGLGADDYLTKPFGRQELLARIGAVMRRAASGPAVGSAVAEGVELDGRRHVIRVRGLPLDLTPTEYRLLEALLRAGGDVVPHFQLARAGWPTEADPDLLWLKPHVTRLRAKVTAAGGPGIVAVRGVGYRLLTDDGPKAGDEAPARRLDAAEA